MRAVKLRPWHSVAALLAAAFVLVWFDYEGDLRHARERVAGSQVAQTSCGPIEYATAGEGPAVLVVHGAGGGFDQPLGFVEEFSRAGFRAVAMSRFGYLRTPLPPDASPAAQADAHACLLDALGIGRAAIVGVSAGAPSTMQFALHRGWRRGCRRGGSWRGAAGTLRSRAGAHPVQARSGAVAARSLIVALLARKAAVPRADPCVFIRWVELRHCA